MPNDDTLTEHFSLDELTLSQTAVRMGLDNTPAPSLLPNLRILAEGLERVRAILGQPILVTSGYRSARLNAIVGGAPDSRHMVGLAADVLCPRFGPPLAVCQAIVDAGLEVDQLIHEYGRWTHVAFAAAGQTARRQILTIADATHGYREGLHPVALRAS